MKIFNKFLLISFIFLFILSTSVMATDTFSYTISSLPEEIFNYIKTTEEYNNLSNYYYFAFQSTSSNYCITFIPKEQLNSSLQGYFMFNKGTKTSYCFNQAFTYKQYLLNTDYTLFNTTSNTSGEGAVWEMCYSSDNDNYSCFWYSTFDMFTDNTYSTVFFRVPVTEVVIPALETAEQIPETIAKALKIVIPVGLIVLGIGLLIYLTKRAIFLIH